MGISLIVNSLVSIIAYALLVVGVYRIYQIATEVSEIKELLRDIKRNTENAPALAVVVDKAAPLDGPGQSLEGLARAIHAASYPLPQSPAAPQSQPAPQSQIVRLPESQTAGLAESETVAGTSH